MSLNIVIMESDKRTGCTEHLMRYRTCKTLEEIVALSKTIQPEYGMSLHTPRRPRRVMGSLERIASTSLKDKKENAQDNIGIIQCEGGLTVDGVHYINYRAARDSLGVTIGVIGARVKSPYWPTWVADINVKRKHVKPVHLLIGYNWSTPGAIVHVTESKA